MAAEKSAWLCYPERESGDQLFRGIGKPHDCAVETRQSEAEFLL
jgi:hypothetical protein